jgi:hypothetical protein
VRNRVLHDRLFAFAEEAAEHLTKALESGLELEFEVDERPGQSSVLYRYRPLSDRFVRERFGELRELEGFGPAMLALGKVEGISSYLRVLGISYVPTSERDRAEAVLREFLARLWEDVSAFEHDAGRFDRTYSELESVVYENTVVSTVLAPIVGVKLAAERWDLGAGVELVRGDLCDAPPEAVWAAGREEHDPNTLVVLTVEASPQDPPPLTAARIGFRKLLTALRLLKSGGAALGSNGWWRLDDGPWQALDLGHAGRPRAGDYWLEEADRRELMELFEIVRVRPLAGGALPWALARFELGCEQRAPLDGLTDHLLALKALLDGDTESPASLGDRLAALCAEPAGRAQLAERVDQALRLERLVMRGDLDGRSLRSITEDAADVVAHDLESQLRAILRDMVCGYLKGDVRRIADDLLRAESASKPEPRIEERKARPAPKRRARPRVERRREVVEPDDVPDADEPPEPQFAAARAQRPKRAAGSTPGRRTEAEEQPTEEVAAIGAFAERPGGSELDDWGFDDDPADYSAAV